VTRFVARVPVFPHVFPKYLCDASDPGGAFVVFFFLWYCLKMSVLQCAPFGDKSAAEDVLPANHVLVLDEAARGWEVVYVRGSVAVKNRVNAAKQYRRWVWFSRWCLARSAYMGLCHSVRSGHCMK